MFTNMVTNRLLIRRFTVEDWYSIHEYHSDPFVVQYETFSPFTKEQSYEAAEYYAQSPNFWALCLKGRGPLIGHIFLANCNNYVWNLGFILNRKYHQQGYATEACFALLDYVFQQQEAHRIIAECQIKNIASYRLLERLGFQREGHLRQHAFFKRDSQGNPVWIDSYMYGLLKQEWNPSQKIVSKKCMGGCIVFKLNKILALRQMINQNNV